MTFNLLGIFMTIAQSFLWLINLTFFSSNLSSKSFAHSDIFDGKLIYN